MSRYERSLAPLPDFVKADVRGGETEVCIRTPFGFEFKSVAKCSKKDVYVRSVGLNNALDELLKESLKAPKVTTVKIDPPSFTQLNLNLNVPVNTVQK
jgi:hypothetical protein